MKFATSVVLFNTTATVLGMIGEMPIYRKTCSALLPVRKICLGYGREHFRCKLATGEIRLNANYDEI